MNAETVARQEQVAELIDRLATAERQRDAVLDALREAARRFDRLAVRLRDVGGPASTDYISKPTAAIVCDRAQEDILSEIKRATE